MQPTTCSSLLCGCDLQHVPHWCVYDLQRDPHCCVCELLLILHRPPIPHIPHHHELAVLFAPDVIQGLDWKVAQHTFPLTVPLVSMETYAYHTLLGLSVSVGGLTESTVSCASFISLSDILERYVCKLTIVVLRNSPYGGHFLLHACMSCMYSYMYV